MKKIKPQNFFLNIVYEDKDILIIDKQLNSIVHTNDNIRENTIVNGLINYIDKSYSLPRSGLIHRLDKNTTGLMVIAKNIQSQKNIMLQFKKKCINKFYVAIVHGSILNGGIIRNTLRRDGNNYLKMKIINLPPEDYNSVTHYRVLNKYKRYTLLSIKLETGKTHQIRIHLSHQSSPIVGESLYQNKYGNLDKEMNIRHHLLHAKYLQFFHPIHKKKLSFFSKIPDYFFSFLNSIEK